MSLMPKTELIIALPASVQTPEGETPQAGHPDFRQSNSDSESDIIRRETLGFFQLAIAYGVHEQIEDVDAKMDFYRDLQITNRYLNTKEATYESMRRYAGFGTKHPDRFMTKQAVQLIVKKTMHRLFDNFPWDLVADEVRDRYPEELVVQGKNRGEMRKLYWEQLTSQEKDEIRQKIADGHNTEESKTKQSQSAKLFWESEKGQAARQTIIKKRREWEQTPEGKAVRAKLAENNRVRVVSEDTREKIRQSKLGKSRPPEVVEKVKAKVTGKKRTPEQRQHMSDAQRQYWASDRSLAEREAARQRARTVGSFKPGHHHSDEIRRKISEGNKGKKRSAEARANIKAAQLQRRERERQEKAKQAEETPVIDIVNFPTPQAEQSEKQTQDR